MDHCNGKEFEKLLAEAQANIMKSIPNLEMPPASGPLPKGDAPVDKLEPSGELQSHSSYSGSWAADCPQVSVVSHMEACAGKANGSLLKIL